MPFEAELGIDEARPEGADDGRHTEDVEKRNSVPPAFRKTVITECSEVGKVQREEPEEDQGL